MRRHFKRMGAPPPPPHHHHHHSSSSYANGDMYGGEWQDGKRHGMGVHYFSSGNVYMMR